MFFSINFLLLLFITAINSRPNNHHANESIDFNATVPMILKADSSNVAKENGENVELIGRGSVNLTLSYDILEVKIDLNNCIGLVKFCYSSLEKNDEAALHCGNGFCGFRVEGKSDKYIDLMEVKNYRKTLLDKPCLPIRMKQTETSYCGMPAASCKPFIIDKWITVIVEDVSSDCRMFITNAKIYYPQTTTSTSLPSSKSSTQTATSEASNEWYIWVIIGVAFVLLIGIIIAIFICWKKQICLFKKKTEAAKKRTTITDTVESGGIVRKAEDIPEPKLESKPETKPKTPAEEIPQPPKAVKKSKKKKSMKSKKGKKQKTPVKKDTKDDPIPPEAPVVDAADLVTPSMEPDSVAPPPPPISSRPLSDFTEEQVLAGDYYTPKKLKWIKSRSSKSDASNRKSIGPPPVVTPMIEMKLEPHYSSLRRWKKSGMEESKWKEFEQHYKVDPTKKPLDVEVSLLYGYIGDIFATINRLIKESQTTLKEKCAEFRRNGKASKKFPETVYEYLEDSNTPEYVRYTAMGSEIGKGVFLGESKIEQYSLSALLLIGFTTSIRDKKRRHALAVLRRKLPKLRQKISVEDREKYGFPANGIELAFKYDSRLFENVEAMKTDSTKNNSEVTQE